MSPLVSEKKKQSLVDVCKNQNIDVTEYSEAKKGKENSIREAY